MTSTISLKHALEITGCSQKDTPVIIATGTTIREDVDNSEVALLWERKIADGIGGVEAKTVTVEFELNGRKTSAKINPETIIRKMIDNDYFSGYDFEVVKRGDELIKKLGAKEWGETENVLRCRNITKITYGRKELYVRE